MALNQERFPAELQMTLGQDVTLCRLKQLVGYALLRKDDIQRTIKRLKLLLINLCTSM